MSARNRVAILFLLLVLPEALPSPAPAELLPVRTYGAADRLASDSVSGVLADSRGFVWFSSNEGVSRFDGYAFTTYSTAHGLPDRRVTDLLETRSGEYFVATLGGLARFDPRGVPGQPFVRIPIGDRAGELYCLLETRDGRLLCGGADGLHVLDAQLRASPVDLGTDGSVYALFEDRWGAVWAGMASAIRRVRPGAVDTFPLPERLAKLGVELVFEDVAGRLWACTRAGAMVAGARVSDDAPVEFDTAGPASRTGWLTGYLRARDGAEWVASAAGLARLSDNGTTPTVERVPTVSGVCDREVWGLAQDRTGNLWLATSCGALRVALHGFIAYGVSDGLSSVAVNSLFESRSGEFIVTTNASGRDLHVFDGRRFARITPRADIPASGWGWGWGQTALQARDGAWWVPTASGALRYPPADRPETALERRPQVIAPGAEAFRLFADSRGDVWISTTGLAVGVLRWERATGRVVDITPVAGTEYTAFAETGAGALWIGTSNAGLLRYADGRFERFGSAEGAPVDYVRALHVDATGSLWTASNLSGVTRIADPDAARPVATRYTTEEGLSSNNVYAVVDDALGRIYAGTSVGVDRIDLATGRVRRFTSADGLPKGAVSKAFRDRSGRLWFGTDFGLAALDPGPDPPPVPPRTLVTAVRVAGAQLPVSLLGESSILGLSLGPSETNLSVDFLGVGSGLGEEFRYQYRLEGAEGDWSAPAPERTVTFANLAPGSYRFLVRAVDGSGLASPEPASVAFSVAAPVWRRWWFLTLAAVLTCAAAYALYRARVARLLEVERVRTRIASDLHDDIGANLTRIAVLSEAAGYRRAAGADDSESLASIARISRESVASMSDIVWAISPERDSFRDLVRRMRELAGETLESSGVEVRFTAPEGDGDLRLGHDTRREVFLIFKEALANAARHAGCTRADVMVRLERRTLVLEIVDDGRGFDPSARPGGNGLANMRKRAAAVGGTLDVRSSPDAGTTVRLTVPLGRRPT